MIAQASKSHNYTVAEYFDLEIAAETRHEYRQGEIIPMTGGTPSHNDIASNLMVALKLALKGKPYRIFIVDQRLWIPDRSLYTYPDIMILEKPIKLQTGRNDTVVNPCFIGEVLSQSTKDYDRGEKFAAYRTIASFQEYLPIDRYRIYVEHYIKTAANQWLLSEYEDPNTTLFFSPFDFQIKIRDLYENIEFE
jgi:Uma2 family endonuclease